MPVLLADFALFIALLAVASALVSVIFGVPSILSSFSAWWAGLRLQREQVRQQKIEQERKLLQEANKTDALKDQFLDEHAARLHASAERTAKKRQKPDDEVYP